MKQDVGAQTNLNGKEIAYTIASNNCMSSVIESQEKETEELEAEIAKLKAENQRLRLQIDRLKVDLANSNQDTYCRGCGEPL